MQKQIKIFWGRMDYPNENYELTVGLSDENSNYYSVSLTSIEYVGYEAAHNMGLPSGDWDLNNIYAEIEDDNNMYREGEKIYIKKGFDEEKGNQHNPNIIFPFGNARLEYFIPASNNNDSSDDDNAFGVFGGGKRKRTRHNFVGKRVASLPPPSQQSEFYKKTKANIKRATKDFLKHEKIRQNVSLTYTPSEENFILEATEAKKGGGKYHNMYEVNTNVKVYWRNDNGTYSPHIAKITAINNNEITLTFKNPRYIWRGDPETATDEKGNKLIEKIQREFPRIPKKGGYGGKSTKKRTKSLLKKKRTKSLFKKKRTKSLFKKKRTKRRKSRKKRRRTKRKRGRKSPKRRRH